MLKKTILMADDDRDFLKIGELFLQRAGFKVVTAQDGYHALHLALTADPSLMLLDINMPAGSGWSVNERIRANAPTSGLPIVYITGERGEAVRAEAARMGAAALLYKPLEYDVLLTTIKAILNDLEMCKPKLTALPKEDSHDLWPNFGGEFAMKAGVAAASR